MTKTLFRTRIKFCGMTRPGDVRLASELGVDAIGFVFAPQSPRRLQPEEARAMRNAMEPLVDAVALFKDNGAEEIRDVIKQVRPSLLQFHGREDDGFCRSFGLPYIKGIPMGGLDPARRASQATQLHLQYPAASAFLFDGHAQGEQGGTGRTFDWSQLPTGLGKPFVLAGGLGPNNVFDAVTQTLPWGVDVASGIESAPGIKDGDKMRRFVEEVRRADCHPD
jgi:phosphoribosylanthranilate isomerase